MTTKRDFTQFVHETEVGSWAVGEWSQVHAQFTCPLYPAARRVTGCSAAFARRSSDLPYQFRGPKGRQQALRAARYLYGEMLDLRSCLGEG